MDSDLNQRLLKKVKPPTRYWTAFGGVQIEQSPPDYILGYNNPELMDWLLEPKPPLNYMFRHTKLNLNGNHIMSLVSICECSSCDDHYRVLATVEDKSYTLALCNLADKVEK